MSVPDSRDAADLRARAWSEYWASGALHSCAGSFSGNYGGAIAAFWREVFTRLRTDATVLDVCCGNAPLSKLLIDERDFLREGRIDAVDAARIAPVWIQELAPDACARLRLHAGVDAAALPFDASCFDLCMSQYGVEYVGESAMREIARVLKPGGVFAAVLHHVAARPVRIARAELDHLDWLRQPQGVLEAAARMIEPMARSATSQGQQSLRSDDRANMARAQFNLAMQALDGRAAQPFPDLLLEVRDAVAATLGQSRLSGEGAGQAAWAALARDLDANELRQRELVECALDESAARALLAPLGDATPRVSTIEFEPGEIAGWAVVARRV
jgi:ubiquinone/menaquinone biosynthesis C-methylase UbiE